jgi:hypothetical protein
MEISRFCDHIVKDRAGNAIELVWAEPRDIERIEIELPSPVNNAETGNSPVSTVSYWKAAWPETRMVPGTPEGSGQSGWASKDDWYRGTWKVADAIIEENPSHVSCRFDDLALQEYPKLDFHAITRCTLKLKIAFDPTIIPVDDIGHIEVHSSATCSDRAFVVICPQDVAFVARAWNGTFPEGNKATGCTTIKGRIGDQIAVSACISDGTNDPAQQTVITVAVAGIMPFSFSMNDLGLHGRIRIPELGVEVHDAGAEPSIETDTQGFSIYDRIHDLPEQTFDRAMKPYEGKELMHFVLGCEGVRVKCALSRSGHLYVRNSYIRSVPGRDTPRMFWSGEYFRIGTGIVVDDAFASRDLKDAIVERHVEDGFLPMLTTTWNVGNGIEITQEAYATLLDHTVPGRRPAGDATPVVMERNSVINVGDDARAVELHITFESIGNIDDQALGTPMFEKSLVESGGPRDEAIISLFKGDRRVYTCVAAGLSNSEIEIDTGLEAGPECGITLFIPAGETKDVGFKFPMLAIDPREWGKVVALDFEKEKFRTAIYWRDRIQDGATIDVPNAEFSSFYKANLVHVLTSNDREPGSDRIFGRVGSLVYGTFANEVCMITMDLDRRGMFKDARHILDTFIAFQGTKGLLGDYDDIDGIFFGANGYEHGEGYNQDQGFVLWAIAEHLRLSGDKDWFMENADAIVKGCDWIVREQKIYADRLETLERDMITPSDLSYRGLFPPGGVEDVTDFWHWLSTNAYNSFGLCQAASALSLVGHPDANRIRQAAIIYRADVARAFTAAMQASPVVRLGNGTFVPHFPTRPTLRGRGFGWIQETLEGAIHLVRTWTVNPWSAEAAWIVQDYEDNLYLSERYGYPVPEDFNGSWFDLGGYSQQPFLLCNHAVYATRGETKHFLRAAMNAFSVNYRPDTKSFCEHPLPTVMDVRGDFFKTSDEANFCSCLRAMIVQETISAAARMTADEHRHDLPDLLDDGLGAWEGIDSLFLLQHVPRAWFDAGQIVGGRNLPTYFGKVSIEATLHQVDDGDCIDVSIEIDRSKGTLMDLRSVFLKARHPDELRAIAVVDLDAKIGEEKEAIPLEIVVLAGQSFEIGLDNLPEEWSVLNIDARVKFGNIF